MSDLQSLIDTSLRRARKFTRTILGEPMSARQVAEFVNDLKSGVLATVKQDGGPHLSAMLFAYADSKLYTCVHPLSLCYKNLRRDSRVSAAFTERGGKGRTVILQGRALEIAKINRVLSTVVKKIESEIGPWLSPSSATHSSLRESQDSLFEVKIERIFTYSP